MENNNIISTKNLTIGYKNKKKTEALIKKINIEIPQGKLIAVIGTNGAGKSTFIRTLAGQQPQLSGSIFLNSIPQEQFTSNEWARQVAWVQTDVSVPLNLTVEEFISLGRQPYTNWLDSITDEDRKIISQVIISSDLEELKKKKCNQLSDGQLQRVYIARALAQDTPIIILDEPTTHLDIIHKINTLHLLNNFCQEFQKTIIYTTHEIELSIQISEYIIGIHNNSIVIDTTLNVVKKNLLNSIFKCKHLTFCEESKKFILYKK